MGNRSELLQGTLDVLLLKAFARSEMHGYAVAEWIYTASGDALQIEEAALYPALHRLEVRGLLRSRWGVSENNRRAKYYRLTVAGSRQVRDSTESWRRSRTAIDRVLESS